MNSDRRKSSDVTGSRLYGYGWAWIKVRVISTARLYNGNEWETQAFQRKLIMYE